MSSDATTPSSTHVNEPAPSKWAQCHYLSELAVRYWLSFAFLGYGIAKLIGAQFFHAGPELDTHARELDGFTLTWLYFGYAPTYAKLIGAGQVCSACLLIFDRTKRMGAYLLLPIITNIFLVNYFYQITDHVMFLSTAYLLGTLYLLAPDVPRLWRFLWVESAHRGRPPLLSRYRVGMLAIGVVFLLAASTHITRKMTGMERRARPFGYGDYVAVVEKGKDKPMWERVYLRHLGLLQAFRGKRGYVGRYRFHTAKKTFTIRLKLRRGKQRITKRITGTYQRQGQQLRLKGTYDARPFHLLLKRLQWPPQKTSQ